LNLNAIPSSIIIVGGSVIGAEFATFFAELGTKVTMVEILDKIIPLEDQECADLLKQELTRMGVVIHTSTKLESLKDTGRSVAMVAQKDGSTWRSAPTMRSFAQAENRYYLRQNWTNAELNIHKPESRWIKR